MEKVISASLVVLTGSVVASVLAFLATARFDSCHEPPDAVWSPRIASAANSPNPTLAPRPAVVTLQVETDKADIEVRWAEN